MDKNKAIIYLLVFAIVVALVGGILFLVYSSSSKDTKSSSEQNLQEAINNPIERNNGWDTLVDGASYQISHAVDNNQDYFFITINDQPVLQTSLTAEQALVSKLNVDTEFLCQLPVVINIPAMVDTELSQFNFGLSFCPDRIHISDIIKS